MKDTNKAHEVQQRGTKMVGGWSTWPVRKGWWTHPCSAFSTDGFGRTKEQPVREGRYRNTFRVKVRQPLSPWPARLLCCMASFFSLLQGWGTISRTTNHTRASLNYSSTGHILWAYFLWNQAYVKTPKWKNHQLLRYILGGMHTESQRHSSYSKYPLLTLCYTSGDSQPNMHRSPPSDNIRVLSLSPEFSLFLLRWFAVSVPPKVQVQGRTGTSCPIHLPKK